MESAGLRKPHQGQFWISIFNFVHTINNMPGVLQHNASVWISTIF